MPEPDHYHANLQRGSLLLDQDRPKEALPFFQAAIAANPEAAHGYAELARCYNEIPAQRSKAIGAINRAIGLAPNVSYYYGRKGWFLVCLMNFRGAYKAACEGLAINPTCPQSLNALANAHTKLGQWKKAEEACHRILAQNPHDSAGLNLLAQALRHLGRWKESREVVARLLANMPNNSFGHANAGYAALAAGDHLRANEHFLESLRMDPHSDLARRGLLSSLRARIWIIRFNHRVNSVLRDPTTVPHYKWNFLLGFIIFAAISLSLFLLSGKIPTVIAVVWGIAVVCLALFIVGLLFYLYLTAIVGLMVNFVLLFHPIGRYALKPREKYSACIPAIGFIYLFLAVFAHAPLGYSLGFLAISILLALSIQFPLLKDLWPDRRARESVE